MAYSPWDAWDMTGDSDPDKRRMLNPAAIAPTRP
jgi:hypothetical protein